jgi:soluble lytic murein transglycosylase
MRKQFFHVFSISVFSLVLLTIGCSAQQNEEQALRSLREMTRGGKLPAEGVVADIENRFSNKKTGALAKLLRARIRFENKDFAGAAAILDSDVFKKRTKIEDDALWLRARSLRSAGDTVGALKVAEKLLKDYPDSTRARDAKLLWADAAIANGRAVEVPPFLVEMSTAHDADALLWTAKAYEAQGSQNEAVTYYRRTFFYGAGTAAPREAEAKLTSMGQALTPQNAEEQLARADKLLDAKNFAEAANVFATLAAAFPAAIDPAIQTRRITALANAGRMAEAQTVFNSLPVAAAEREEGYRQLVLGYAKARNWPQTRFTADAMRQAFPNGKLVPKTFIDAGLAARDARNRTDEGYFLNTAHNAFPKAVEVAQAQFEAAWFQHEQRNFAVASQMFIDHLARYADRDTSNRGKAGYWSARDSERAGKIAEACTLYDAVIYRYSANWYGYLAGDRMDNLKKRGECRSVSAPNDTVARAAANLKTITVAGETAAKRELDLVEKSDELTTIGLFDWALDELNAARRTAGNSPTVNIAIARHHRMRGDNVAALLALARSYPDYAQMFPEEMSTEEWDIFYPHIAWDHVARWSRARNLDIFKVAGLIRQESVFNPTARSSANAFGLMQLLVPTAQLMARKHRISARITTGSDLYDPALNIELGTAYMREQLDRYGRIEYMAVAYNAGPGRVVTWRRTLPAEMDEFVEAIPFNETKRYVQGIIRNTAQYRRLYDESGNFRPNVGTRQVRAAIDSLPLEQLAKEYPEIVVISQKGE